MSFRFTVLASGSAGNASLLQADEFGVLIDAGLGPRQLGWRLGAVGLSWRHVHAVLLTHTHSDHWKARTLAQLRRLRVPIYCHLSHHDSLRAYAAEFASLCDDDLVRPYDEGETLALSPTLTCLPFSLQHDGGATFGFRFEGSADFYGKAWALAYAADLGSWTPELARVLADVDLLALEFNHDVYLEQTSGRSPYLIARVLGDEGHLSNAQAASLLDAVLRLSTPGRLRQVVQLHLSRECNRPELAAEAAHTVLAEHGPVALHTALQDEPGPTLTPVASPGHANGHLPTPDRRPRPRQTVTRSQPFLPGLEA
jgi:phosphoribosyl 1,2-cyclic phosphodiesterase